MSAPPKPLPKWSYALTAIPAVVGVAVVAWLVVGLVDEIQAMPRVKIPGTGDVALRAGDYMVYAEYDGAGGDTQRANLSFRCTATDTASGEPAALTAPGSTTKYNLAGISGRSAFALTVPRDGTYRLGCDGAAATMAIGPPMLSSIVSALIAGFGGVALTVIAIVLVRRQRRRAGVA